MIASISGPVGHVGLDRVVVVVGGVGLQVHTTPAVAATCRTGTPIELATTLVVREDSLTLYGFAGQADRDMFETVQTVTGVGPRLALAMLSVLTPDQVRAAVGESDLATLSKVPGVGKRLAERLALELRDKVGPPAGADQSGTSPSQATGDQAWREQVSAALTGLGWTAKQAGDALDAVAPPAGETVDISVLLRNALRVLGR